MLVHIACGNQPSLSACWIVLPLSTITAGGAAQCRPVASETLPTLSGRRLLADAPAPAPNDQSVRGPPKQQAMCMSLCAVQAQAPTQGDLANLLQAVLGTIRLSQYVVLQEDNRTQYKLELYYGLGLGRARSLPALVSAFSHNTLIASGVLEQPWCCSACLCACCVMQLVYPSCWRWVFCCT